MPPPPPFFFIGAVAYRQTNARLDNSTLERLIFSTSSFDFFTDLGQYKACMAWKFFFLGNKPCCTLIRVRCGFRVNSMIVVHVTYSCDLGLNPFRRGHIKQITDSSQLKKGNSRRTSQILSPIKCYQPYNNGEAVLKGLVLFVGRAEEVMTVPKDAKQSLSMNGTNSQKMVLMREINCSSYLRPSHS